MRILQISFLGVCALTFVVYAGGNWIAFFLFVVRKRQGVSFMPPIGGLFGFLGLLFSPWPMIRNMSWIPIVLDPGTWVLFGSLQCIMAPNTSQRTIRAGSGKKRKKDPSTAERTAILDDGIVKTGFPGIHDIPVEAILLVGQKTREALFLTISSLSWATRPMATSRSWNSPTTIPGSWNFTNHSNGA